MSCLHPFRGALFVITVFALIKIYVTAPWAVMKWITCKQTHSVVRKTAVHKQSIPIFAVYLA